MFVAVMMVGVAGRQWNNRDACKLAEYHNHSKKERKDWVLVQK